MIAKLWKQLCITILQSYSNAKSNFEEAELERKTKNYIIIHISCLKVKFEVYRKSIFCKSSVRRQILAKSLESY